MSSLLVFTPDLTQPSLFVSAEISATQVDALEAFRADQNDFTPGRYPTLLDMLMSNQREGLLNYVLTNFPPPLGEPVAMSGIEFVPNLADPENNRQGDVFTDQEMRSLATWMAGQNAGEPGKYAGNFDVIVHNLHDELFTAVLNLFPPDTVATANAAVTAAQTARQAALDASNPLAVTGADPVAILPYD